MDKEARDFHESALMAMAGAVTEADTVDGDYVTGFAVVMFTKQGREIASAGFTEEAGTNSDLFPDEVAAVISENLDDADEQESA